MIDKVLQILTFEENILTLSRHGFCFCFCLFWGLLLFLVVFSFVLFFFFNFCFLFVFCLFVCLFFGILSLMFLHIQIEQLNHPSRTFLFSVFRKTHYDRQGLANFNIRKNNILILSRHGFFFCFCFVFDCFRGFLFLFLVVFSFVCLFFWHSFTCVSTYSNQTFIPISIKDISFLCLEKHTIKKKKKKKKKDKNQTFFFF